MTRRRSHGPICNPASDPAVLSVFRSFGQQAAPGFAAGQGRQRRLFLCQITSNPYADPRAVTLAEADFAEGGLQRISHARASKLFTAHESLFQRAVGEFKADRHAQVVETVVEMVRAGV